MEEGIFMKIFLCEDEKDILSILMLFIKKQWPTMEVSFFSNPYCLLDELKDSTPDIIISDFNFADYEMNGVDLYNQLKEKLNYKFHFLLFTSEPENKFMDKINENNFIYSDKLNFDQLLEKLEVVIANISKI